MSDYYQVYRQRLNRYGLDFQSRIEGSREREFENYLYKTIYRVEFQVGDKRIPGSLERYKQDASETQGYLLTRKEDVLPSGTILEIESRDGRKNVWMVWWLEQIESSGYNKYVVLKMTHYLHCGEVSQWSFFEGPAAKAVKDAVQLKTPLFSENDQLHLFITPANDEFVRDYYFTIGEGNKKDAYVVTFVDNYTTPGIAYVSVDPVAVRDESETPIQTPDEEDKDYYWLNGGAN